MLKDGSLKDLRKHKPIIQVRKEKSLSQFLSQSSSNPETRSLLLFASDNPFFGHQRSVCTMSNKVTSLGAKLRKNEELYFGDSR